MWEYREREREIRQSRKLDMLNFGATRLRINCTENVQLMPEEIIEIILLLWQQDIFILRPRCLTSKCVLYGFELSLVLIFVDYR